MSRPQPDKAGPGQESVWDYPRPPRLEQTRKRIQVVYAGVTIADTREAWRVLETSHPPVYYLPPQDIVLKHLREISRTSFCEWKGRARYFDVCADGGVAESAAWAYPSPVPAFEPLRDHVAFYAPAMERCTIDGETVVPQPGGFYGGWITSDIVGPFKGVPGSDFW